MYTAYPYRSMETWKIRKAVSTDIPNILQMIKVFECEHVLTALQHSDHLSCDGRHQYYKDWLTNFSSQDLAVYEKEPESVVKLTEEEMLRDGFGEKPWFWCLIAEELQHKQGTDFSPETKAVGYSLYYYRYSTWEGRSLYMEDLYVDPASRGKGIGKAILKKVAEIAVQNGCNRVDWMVLDWNKPARDFYDSIGATCLDEWQLYRIKDDRLLEFSGQKCFQHS